MGKNKLNSSDEAEFTKLIADDLESGELEKVIGLFRYNTTLFELVGNLIQDERMKVRLGTHMVMDELVENQNKNTALAIPGLIDALSNESPTFRGDAADLLGMIGQATEIQFLEPLLTDESIPVVETAAEAIQSIRDRITDPSEKYGLVFLHGMESSPKGIKAKRLRQRYAKCQIPSLPPDIHQRAKILEALIKRPSNLIGSSLGGLSAILFAMNHPEKVNKMILLAPAVGFFDTSLFNDADMRIIKSTVIPEGIETVIIAGNRDEVIPLDDIKSLITRSPDTGLIELITVDDDHGLNQSPELLLNLVEQRFGI